MTLSGGLSRRKPAVADRLAAASPLQAGLIGPPITRTNRGARSASRLLVFGQQRTFAAFAGSRQRSATPPPSALDRTEHVNAPFVATFLCHRDQWGDDRPLLASQVARIAQRAPVMPRPVRFCPHFETAAIRSATG